MNPDYRRTSLAPTLSIAAALLCILSSPLVSAQGVYRIVGPDGRVSYSDQPPPATANARPVGGAQAPASTSALPLEVRNAVGRYPVILYSGNDCAPCDRGRSFLLTRGIPFTEKTVNSNDDIAALKRVSGASSLPMLSIGAQQLKGYSETEWAQYLDAAGYPKASALPAGYRRTAASPLVEAKTTAAPAASRVTAERPAAEAPTEVPVAPPVTNPSGIRF